MLHNFRTSSYLITGISYIIDMIKKGEKAINSCKKTHHKPITNHNINNKIDKSVGTKLSEYSICYAPKINKFTWQNKYRNLLESHWLPIYSLKNIDEQYKFQKLPSTNSILNYQHSSYDNEEEELIDSWEPQTHTSQITLTSVWDNSIFLTCGDSVRQRCDKRLLVWVDNE
ncbi:unnamed protein product [Trichobilharzia regenti]|uniref:EEV126 n=1 Tax=Trichobilharzia regenti TaxID=157069 RepID=A0A183VHV4_TRIRE|nr:unnamed protein product [Trichobilharzia regenti]VDP96830.1 unnamed protein product [Trichobilharzia regenti]